MDNSSASTSHPLDEASLIPLPLSNEIKNGLKRAEYLIETMSEQIDLNISEPQDMEMTYSESVEPAPSPIINSESIMNKLNEILGKGHPAWIAFCNLRPLTADEDKDTTRFLEKHLTLINENTSTGSILIGTWLDGLAKGRSSQAHSLNIKPFLRAIKGLEANLVGITRGVLKDAKALRQISVTSNTWTAYLGKATLTIDLASPNLSMGYRGVANVQPHPLKCHATLLTELPKKCLMVFYGDNVEALLKLLTQDKTKNMDSVTRGSYVLRQLKFLEIPSELLVD